MDNQTPAEPEHSVVTVNADEGGTFTFDFAGFRDSLLYDNYPETGVDLTLTAVAPTVAVKVYIPLTPDDMRNLIDALTTQLRTSEEYAEQLVAALEAADQAADAAGLASYRPAHPPHLAPPSHLRPLTPNI